MNMGIRTVIHRLALLSLLCIAPSAFAETAAEALEKGIYNEDTTGNLTEAIKHYETVLEKAKDAKNLAAQAQFRLGTCLSKLGKKDTAEFAFRKLISDYPDQKELVAKARKLLPAPLQLSAPRWKSGEHLTYSMALAGGRQIGLVGTAIKAGQKNGRDVWEMDIRRYIIGGANSGVSHVVIDQKTNHPITTDWDHTILGTASAEWSDEKILITKTNKDGKKEKDTVKLDTPAYSNDQWMFGFRQLPLKVGAKLTVPVRVAFTGGATINIEINVRKKESVKTPVGTFDCFRLDTNIQQTFWITDTSERYIAKFEAGGVVSELSSIDDDQPVLLSSKHSGFSITKPAGWFHTVSSADAGTTTEGFTLVSPTDFVSTTVKVRPKSSLDAAERKSAAAWAEEIANTLLTSYKEATKRENLQTEAQLADVEGASIVIDYTASDRKMVTSSKVSLKGEKAIQLVNIGQADSFAKHQAEFDAIRESLTVK